MTEPDHKLNTLMSAADAWTRRDVLRSVAAFAAAGFVWSAITGSAAWRTRADLFAFSAGRPDRLVIALVTEMPALAAAPERVLLHASNRQWNIDGADDGGRYESGDRLFSGAIIGRGAGRDRVYKATLIETQIPPTPAQGSLGIWAERFGANGRERIGNPIVAELLTADRALHALHSETTPQDDRSRLAVPLAEYVANIAARAGVRAPRAYALRVVERFLPDVIAFRPGSPIGFTFAAQNGRHPAEDVNRLSAAILSGSPAALPRSTHFAISNIFPYFTSSGSLVSC